MTFASPFIDASGSGLHSNADAPQASRRWRDLGRRGNEAARSEIFAPDLLQQFGSAFSAATASGSNTQFEGQLVDALHALARAIAYLPVGDSVADTDVHSLQSFEFSKQAA
jgi:hypothetical protein